MRGTSRRYRDGKMLPLVRMAAFADWLKIRRRARLPWGDRLLLDTSADSSRPGQTLTQDASWAAESKVAACGSHFRKHLWGRVDAKTWHCR